MTDNSQFLENVPTACAPIPEIWILVLKTFTNVNEQLANFQVETMCLNCLTTKLQNSVLINSLSAEKEKVQVDTFSEFCALQSNHLQSSLTCLGVDWVAGTRRLIPWVIRDGMLYINNSRIIPRPDTGSNILKDINNCSIACLNTDITKIVCVANHTNDFTCLFVTSCKHLTEL